MRIKQKICIFQQHFCFFFFKCCAKEKCFLFRWNCKPDKVRRKLMVGPICKGGLSMVHFSDVVKSLSIAWVNRYCKAPDNHWCALLIPFSEELSSSNVIIFELKLLDVKNLPAFYKNVLAESLWHNRFVMISEKSIYYKTWVNRGILKVCFEDLNANLEFAVLFSITLVFLLQFLKFGGTKS